MNRDDFHKMFKAPGPVVLPVIHVLDAAQTVRNVRIAIESGAAGVFLINHDFALEALLPIVREVRAAFPTLWLGVNFLAVTGEFAFPVLARLQSDGCQVDGYWGDDARIDEHKSAAQQPEATRIADIRRESGWQGLYLGGTCFKKQREVLPEKYGTAASLAAQFMDGVCTSGVATGHEADLTKIQTFRAAIGETVLALASGITPENAHSYSDVDCFMVATGISAGDFYNIDAGKLDSLMQTTRRLGAQQ